MITTTGGDIRLDAGGEGSRGGHIIGHTKSGKPVYADYKHPSHRSFSGEEHREASKLNSRVVQAAGTVPSAWKKKRTPEHLAELRQRQKAADWHYGRQYEADYGAPHPHPKFKDYKHA